MYLEERVIHVSGLGLYIYSGPRAERPSDRALVERRLAQIQFGSPQLWCELSIGAGEPSLGEVLARAVFPLDVRSGVLSLCDGYAEMDWDGDDYAHVHVAVPPSAYDVVLTAHRARAENADWALDFRLGPRARLWRDAEREQVVELFFDTRWTTPPRRPEP